MTSSSWSRTLSTGLSAFIALWKTMEIAPPRRAGPAAGDERGRPERAAHAVGEGRLARSAFPGQADDLAGVELEIHLVYRPHVTAGRAVDDREVTDREYRPRGGRCEAARPAARCQGARQAV